MIFFGSRRRETEVERGSFHCPQCRRSRTYVRRRAANHFSLCFLPLFGRRFNLYFLPLFKLEDLGESVECRGCGGLFEPGILPQAPPTRPVPRPAAGKTRPLPEAELLPEAEPEEPPPQRAEFQGPGARECPECGCSYPPDTARCTNCGSRL